MSGLIKLKPSDVERWSRCTAAPFSSIGVKKKSTVVSEEGTTAHKLFELTIKSRHQDEKGDFLTANDIIQDKEEFTEEMADHVQASVNYIENVIPYGWFVMSERKVSLDFIIPGQTGVADIIAHDHSFQNFIFADFKYGKGILVEARNNLEIMLHAAGYLNELFAAQKLKPKRIKSIKFYILQPRRSHYREWETDFETITRKIKFLQTKAKEALSENDRKFLPHPSACRFCPLNESQKCTALREKIIETVSTGVDAFGSPMYVRPNEKTNEELADLWHWLDFIAAWPKSVKDYMNKKALDGEVFPGLQLMQPREGERKFTNELSAIKICKEELGLEPFEIFESSFLSPAKLEKLIGAKKFDEKFKNLLKREKHSPKLGLEGSGKPYLDIKDEFEDLN